jgi:hypothetical protein
MKAATMGWIVCLLTLALSPAPARAQFSSTEREFRTKQDEKSEIWTLDIKFKDPRMITVYVPGQGTRVYWYLWYQVINRTGEPRRFIPYFEIVTLDHPAAYPDKYYPTVHDAVAKQEDATGYQDIKDSVTISSDMIPVSKPDALPRAVTGLAIWEAASVANPKKRDPKVRELSDTTRFSIFIRGLSNNFVVVNPLAAGQPSITRYKTLQLNFTRKGDRFSTDSRDITFQAPPEWLYRPGNTTIDTKDEKDKKK